MSAWQLAAEMLQAIEAEGSLPYRWLTCDAAFGRDTHFLDTVGDFVSYFAEVDWDTRVWLARPATAVPTWSGQGRPPTRLRLVEGEPDALTVAAIAQRFAAFMPWLACVLSIFGDLRLLSGMRWPVMSKASKNSAWATTNGSDNLYCYSTTNHFPDV